MSTPRTYLFQDLNIIGDTAVPVPLFGAPKDPLETLDYTFDFSAVVNRPIEQFDITINGSPTLYVAQTSIGTTDTLTLWFGGGKAGDVASVSVAIITQTGQRKVVPFVLPLAALAAFPLPTPDILTLNGFPLTYGGATIEVQQPVPVIPLPYETTISGNVLTIGGNALTIGAVSQTPAQQLAYETTIGGSVLTIGGQPLTIGAV